jgi:glycosyltransferase involved in cell wall biosynthesis
VKKILYVHQDGLMTGSAISLSNLLRALDRSRFEPHLVLAREGPARAFFAPLVKSIAVVPADAFWTQPAPAIYDPNYFKNLPGLRRNRAMEEYMAQLAPDVVHVNDKAILCGGRAAARLGLPVVWHLRGAYAGSRSWLQRAVSAAIISRSADVAISISEDEVEEFGARIPVEIIYNTVNIADADEAVRRRAQTRSELGLAEDDIAIGMVGLLNEMKGAWDFIRAGGITAAERPGTKLKFFVVAPIPGREPLNWGWRGRFGLIDMTHPEDRARSLARESGIADRLTLTGRRPDVMNVLAAMDISSVCYRMWAVGRPAFESMAVGCPVIVNQGHSGRSGVVRDGQTGFVVPRGNPLALAAAMVKLVDDPQLRRRLGSQGFAYARENFAADKNARKVEAVYDRLLAPALSRGTKRTGVTTASVP